MTRQQIQLLGRRLEEVLPYFEENQWLILWYAEGGRSMLCKKDHIINEEVLEQYVKDIETKTVSSGNKVTHIYLKSKE